jgi:hypothetical protein
MQEWYPVSLLQQCESSEISGSYGGECEGVFWDVFAMQSHRNLPTFSEVLTASML